MKLAMVVKRVSFDENGILVTVAHPVPAKAFPDTKRGEAQYERWSEKNLPFTFTDPNGYLKDEITLDLTSLAPDQSSFHVGQKITLTLEVE
jgi:hypothetical protein